MTALTRAAAAGALPTARLLELGGRLQQQVFAPVRGDQLDADRQTVGCPV